MPKTHKTKIHKRPFPLTSQEIGKYDLLKILRFGALPSVYASKSFELKDHAAYVDAYLEEMKAQGRIKNKEEFLKFLRTVSLNSGGLIVLTKGMDRSFELKTSKVLEYFEILKDTLMGDFLEPYSPNPIPKGMILKKFYFFDVGISNFLANRWDISPGTGSFKCTLEQFVVMELRAYLSRRKDARPLRFWRSEYATEVKCLIGDEVAIDIDGSKDAITSRNLEGFKSLGADTPFKPRHRLIVSIEEKPRKVDFVEVLPVAEFLSRLWDDKYA